MKDETKYITALILHTISIIGAIVTLAVYIYTDFDRQELYKLLLSSYIMYNEADRLYTNIKLTKLEQQKEAEGQR